MIEFTDVILIALFIEAVVDALKPIWTGDENKLTATEYVSMGMGILLAVTCKINVLAYVVDFPYPLWVEYVFYALTGIAIGRGTNFLYDLWNKLKEWKDGQLLPANEYVFEDGIDSDDLTDNQLRAVLIQLGATPEQISANKTRKELEQLLESYAVGVNDPSVDGGAE